MEQLVQQLLSVLLVLTPTDVTAEQLKNVSPPQVYIIPRQELTQSACGGCNCNMQGMYFGGQGHVLVVAGNYNPQTQETELSADIPTQALLIHELQHYVQHFVYGDKFMEMRNIQQDEGKEFRRTVETEAYEVMNMYVVFNGLPPIDVKRAVEYSVNAFGSPECSPGEQPTPVEQRTRLSDLIEFYNGDTIEYYQQKYGTKWDPYIVDMFECPPSE